MHSFSTALAQGFPLFLDGNVELASPSNGSPFPISRSFLRSELAFSQTRVKLLDSVDSLICTLRTRVKIEAVMLGGSFVRPSVIAPEDVDLVFFYSVTDEAGDIGEFLTKQQEAAQGHHLDVRFVPTDAGPQLLIRAACFFSSLYAQTRLKAANGHGTLLIDGGELQ